MNKTLVVAALIGGMCSNIIPLFISPVIADTRFVTAGIPTNKSRLELLNVGAEPHHKLIFRPALKGKQSINMMQTTKVNMNLDIINK